MQDGQLIVQGPDHEAATAIARQLASGQAKLANLGGKQVHTSWGSEDNSDESKIKVRGLN